MKFICLSLLLVFLISFNLNAVEDSKSSYMSIVGNNEESSVYRSVKIDKELFNILNNRSSFHMTEFPLADEKVNISLTKTNNIFNIETKFYMGNQLVKPPDFQTFTGTIDGCKDSKVVITLSDGMLFGMFTRADDIFYLSPSNGSDYYTLTDNRYPSYPRTQNGDDAPQSFDELTSLKSKLDSYDKPLSSDLLELELAIETDTEFFKATGSDYQKARAYMLTLLTQMNMLYMDFINVGIKLTWLKIWTDSPSDPYDAKGDWVTLRDKAIPYWEANYKDVERDLYHVCTSINYGGGGFGYFDALCGKKKFGMSVSSMQGWNNLPTFDFSYDLYIMSHEIGHNFNAQHTHSCFWNNAPLDTCVVDNGCLPSGQKPMPNPGSIMSYCGGINNESGFGYRVRMIFLPQNIELMRKSAEQATCLTPYNEPFIQLLSPHGSEQFEHSSTIDIKWKTNLTDSIDIRYSADGEQTWVTIAENVEAKSGVYTWKLPDICSNKMELLLTSQSGSIRSSNMLPFTIKMEDSDGLVAHYPFNGNSNDEQLCHFYNAININDAKLSTDRFGNADASYSFAGANYLTAGNFDLSFDSLTVSFWFMLNNTDGKQNLIGTNYQEGWVFETYYWGQLGLSLYVDGKGAPDQLWAGWLNPNQWYFGAFTFDGRTVKYFVDGTKKGEKVFDNPVKLNRFRTPLYIGSRQDNDFMNGKMDDIRIYKRALNESEILGLTNVHENIPNYADNQYISPNPAADYIEIKNVIPAEAGIQVRIFDLLGVEITTPSLRATPPYQGGEKVRIDVSGLAPGVYFVRVGSDVRKFVKM